MALRSRINKRRNILSLAGTPAPELLVEDYVGARPPSLAELRGSPVLLFIWNESCGDCKAQSTSLARVSRRYANRGLRVMTLTRYFDDDNLREKARIDSVWSDVCRAMGPTPIVISTASMERYGGSSTPTLVFIECKGLVRWYTPTRLTEEDLDAAVAELLR